MVVNPPADSTMAVPGARAGLGAKLTSSQMLLCAQKGGTTKSRSLHGHGSKKGASGLMDRPGKASCSQAKKVRTRATSQREPTSPVTRATYTQGPGQYWTL
jgi:hypothetical protein